MRIRTRAAALVAGLAIAAGFWASEAAAQNTATLRGVATDVNGAAVSGGQVAVTGGDIDRHLTTDDEGRFELLQLPPGTYVVTVTAAGFKTFQQGITIGPGGRADMDARLDSGAASEESAPPRAERSPVLNPSPDIRTDLDRKHLKYVPVRRGGSTFDSLGLPGRALSDLSPVGGTSGGPGQMVFDFRNSNTFQIDGVDVTDRSDNRAPLVPYIDEEAIDIATVRTPYSTEFGAGRGGVMQIVTRRGGRDLRGGFHSSFERAPSLGELLEDRPEGQLTFGATLGGPIVRDRLWFFASANRSAWDRTGLAAGTELDTGATSTQFEGKLTARPAAIHSLNATYLHFGDDADGFGAASNRAVETTGTKRRDTSFASGNYSGVIGSNFFVEARASYLKHDLDFTSVGVGMSWEDPSLIRRGSTAYQRGARNSDAVAVTLSGGHQYGTWSKDGRLGFSRTSWEEEREQGWPGARFVLDDGRGQPIQLFTPSFYRAAAGSTEWSFFAQEALNFPRARFDAGFNFGRQNGRNLPSSTGANPEVPGTVPAASFGGNEPVEWSSWMPRFSVTIPGENRRWLVQGTYARYAERLSTNLTAIGNAIPWTESFLGADGFRFLDINGNGRWDIGEPRGASAVIGGVSTSDSQFVEPRSWIASDLAAPATNEVMLRFAWEICERSSFDTFVTWGTTNDLLVQRNLVLDPIEGRRPVRATDYVPASVLTGTASNGEPYSIQGYRSTLPFAGGDLIENGPRRQQHVGVTARWDHRFRNSGYLTGSWTVGRARWDRANDVFTDANDIVVAGDAADDPVADRSTDPFRSSVFLNSRWSYEMRWMTPVGWGAQLSGQLYGRDGYPAPEYVTTSLGDGRTRQIQIGAFDRFRMDAVTMLNFRLSKRFDIRGANLDVRLDGINVLNRETEVRRQLDASRPAFGSALERTAPVSFRIGARLGF